MNGERFDWDILLEKDPEHPPVKRQRQEEVPKAEQELTPLFEEPSRPSAPAAVKRKAATVSEEDAMYQPAPKNMEKTKEQASKPQKEYKGSNGRPQFLNSHTLVDAFILSELLTPRGRWYRRRRR